MTNVFFATNRKKDGTGQWGYGAQSAAHDTGHITFGVASVSGIAVSSAVNLSRCLGYDGPARKHDVSIYPPGKFRIVSCADVGDYAPFNPPDAGHSYYRRSKIVRVEILGAVRNDPGLAAAITSLPG